MSNVLNPWPQRALWREEHLSPYWKSTECLGLNRNQRNACFSVKFHAHPKEHSTPPSKFISPSFSRCSSTNPQGKQIKQYNFRDPTQPKTIHPAFMQGHTESHVSSPSLTVSRGRIPVLLGHGWDGDSMTQPLWMEVLPVAGAIGWLRKGQCPLEGPPCWTRYNLNNFIYLLFFLILIAQEPKDYSSKMSL